MRWPAQTSSSNQATADGGTSLAVHYQILGGPVPAFEVGIYRSADPILDAADMRLDEAPISDPADLTAGCPHQDVTIGTGPGEIALPGAASRRRRRVLPVGRRRPANAVAELDADPVQEDNTAPLTGVYHPAGGDVFVQGTPGGDQITVSSGSLQVVVNGNLLTYDLATTTGLRVRGHAGDDQLVFDAGSGFAADPALQLFVHGGAGNNTLTLQGPPATNWPSSIRRESSCQDRDTS